MVTRMNQPEYQNPNGTAQKTVKQVRLEDTPVEQECFTVPHSVSPEQLTLIQTKSSEIYISTLLIAIFAIIGGTILAYCLENYDNYWRPRIHGYYPSYAFFLGHWIYGYYPSYAFFGLALIVLNFRYCLGDRRVSFGVDGFWLAGNKTKAPTKWVSVRKVLIKRIKESSLLILFFVGEKNKPICFRFDNVFANDLANMVNILAAAGVPHEVDSDASESAAAAESQTAAVSYDTLANIIQNGTLDQNVLALDNPFISDTYIACPVFWKQALLETLICGSFRALIAAVVSFQVWYLNPNVVLSPFLALFFLALYFVQTPFRQIDLQPEEVTIPDWLTRFTKVRWDEIDEFSLSDFATDGHSIRVHLKFRTTQNKKYCIQISPKDKQEFYVLLRTIHKKNKTINLDQSVISVLRV